MKPRSSSLRSILCTLALGLSAACGPGTPGDDAGVIDDEADSDMQGAGTTDAGTTDAGTTDAGTTDAGTTDAGTTDAGTTDAGTTDAGPPPDTLQLVLLTGIYYVPPQSDVSTYDVGEVEWTNNDGIVSLSYQLPRMLVGNSIRVQLAGPVANDGLTAELTGPVGTASCTLDTAGLPVTCTETFNSITLDIDRIQQEAMDLDPANVSARVSVSQSFQVDPIGVFETTQVLSDVVDTIVCTMNADCPGSVCHLNNPGDSYCELHGNVGAGGSCASSFDCQMGFECDLDDGSICSAD